MFICFELFVSSRLVYLSAEFFGRRDYFKYLFIYSYRKKKKKRNGKDICYSSKTPVSNKSSNWRSSRLTWRATKWSSKSLKKIVESLQGGGQPSDHKDQEVCSQCHSSTSQETQKVVRQKAEQQFIVPPVVVVPSASGNFVDGNIFLYKSP